MPQTPSVTPLATEQVIDRLLESVGGQIVACNIMAGAEHGLVDPAWAADVLGWMSRLGAHEDYAGPAQLVRALDDLRTHRLAPGVAMPAELPDLRLGGVDDAVPFEVEASCVLPAWLLGKVMLGEDKQRLAREGLALPRSSADPLATNVVDEWCRKPAEARVVRFNPASSLGRPRSVVWFTRRDALDDALAEDAPQARAQRTRDLLGLVHVKEGAMLAAMHFPPRTLSACASARPTFLDAGSHARFKAWPDGVAARNQRGWGFTVDLGALDRASASVDGCPERITKSFGGGAVGNGALFEFELLGTVQTPAAHGTASDAAFAKRLLNRRTVTELGAELKAISTAR